MSLARHTSYNLIGAALPLLLALVTVPLYLRVIGIERYGVLQIAWLLLGYFGMFDLGLGRATAYRIAAQSSASAQDRAETFWSALVVNLLMGAVGGAILWVTAADGLVTQARVSAALRPEIALSLPWLAAAVPIATATGVLTGALQGCRQFLSTNLISVVSTALFQLLPLAVAVLAGPHVPLLLAAAIGARALGLAALALCCWRTLLHGQRFCVRRQAMADLLRYGGWVTLTAVFGPMLVIVDRFVMSATLGMAAVAVYSIPYNLASRIAVLPAALTNALFPRLSAVAGDAARTMGADALGAVLSFVSPPVLIAIVAAHPFLSVWVGPKLASSAAPVAQWLIFAFWFNALALVAFTRLQASGRPDLVTKILLVQIPPYWAALYLGIHYAGLIGCALAMLGRMVLDFIMQSWGADGAIARGGRVLVYGVTLLGAVLWAQLGPEAGRVQLIGSGLLVAIVLALAWHDAPAAMRTAVVRWSRIKRVALS